MSLSMQIKSIANTPDKVLDFLEQLIIAIAKADYAGICRFVSESALITIHQTTYGREAWFRSYAVPKMEKEARQGTQGSIEHYACPAENCHVVIASFLTWGGDMIDTQSSLITFGLVGDFSNLSVISMHVSVDADELLPVSELKTSGFRFIQGKIVSVNESGPVVNLYVQDAKGRYWIRVTESQYKNLNLSMADNVAVWGSTVWVPQRNGKNKVSGTVEATALNYVRVIDWKN